VRRAVSMSSSAPGTARPSCDRAPEKQRTPGCTLSGRIEGLPLAHSLKMLARMYLNLSMGGVRGCDPLRH
jgi:hypothetical protein